MKVILNCSGLALKTAGRTEAKAKSHIMLGKNHAICGLRFFLASVGFIFSESANRYALTLAGLVLSALFFRWRGGAKSNFHSTVNSLSWLSLLHNNDIR